MKYLHKASCLLLPIIPCSLLANCLSGEDVAQNSNVTLFEQLSYVNKQPSAWRIEDNNPYTRNNGYQNTGIGISSTCALIDNTLSLNADIYGLNEYAFKSVGKFEEDDSHTRVLIDRFSMVYNVSDTVQFEAGKFGANPGLFFLRSPADLQTRYYAGFKSTRLNDPKITAAYQASSWAAKVHIDTQNYSLWATLVPKLATIDKRYMSSENWSATQHGNSDEAYLLGYSDHRFNKHTPTLNLKLGPSPSLALSDRYQYTSQLVINVETAYHRRQQWRHLSHRDADKVQQYKFPTSLYEIDDKEGIELEVGSQYTTDNFTLFGLEYYLQSEGYSRSEQNEQRKLIEFLNTKTNYAPLDEAFDTYKYLMASEISNTSNQNRLQGKQYLNTYARFPLSGQSSLQASMVFNLVDQSSLFGLHYSTPLTAIDNRLESYAGFYSAIGSRYSDFSIFGNTLSVYLGLKFYL